MPNYKASVMLTISEKKTEIKASVIWKNILWNCDKRLANWKRQQLSRGGKLVLLNSFLDSFPTHTMTLSPMPANVEKRLDTIRRSSLEEKQGEKSIPPS